MITWQVRPRLSQKLRGKPRLTRELRGKAQKLLQQKDKKGFLTLLKAQGLTYLPALVDSHVHFRTPGFEYKEDWTSGSKAAVLGGITAVIDMPNTNPAMLDKKSLDLKTRLVKKQLKYPLKYFFHLGATNQHLPDLKLTDKVAGLKVFLGSSTGNLLVDQKEALEKIFKSWPKIICFHAEDEKMIAKNLKKYGHLTNPAKHSLIRNPQVAASALKKVIKLAKKYKKAIYILHVSSQAEIKLIKQAKKQGVKIFAECSPHHLFLNESAYKKWGNFVKVNPPLRSALDQKALWQAVNDGTIDVLGTDHAPHLESEKKLPYEKCPSGIPELDTFLPLMLNAVKNKKLSLNRLLEMMHKNPIKIFNLKNLGHDGVIVNLNLKKQVLKKSLNTKCAWSPYVGLNLTGWPVASILNNKIYPIK